MNWIRIVNMILTQVSRKRLFLVVCQIANFYVHCKTIQDGMTGNSYSRKFERICISIPRLSRMYGILQNIFHLHTPQIYQMIF